MNIKDAQHEIAKILQSLETNQNVIVDKIEIVQKETTTDESEYRQFKSTIEIRLLKIPTAHSWHII